MKKRKMKKKNEAEEEARTIFIEKLQRPVETISSKAKQKMTSTSTSEFKNMTVGKF